MKKYHPADPYSRFLDLQKQGFMRMASKPVKARKAKTPPVRVACDFCMDWHDKNKHTASKEQRAANVAEKKAKDPSFKPAQREI